MGNPRAATSSLEAAARRETGEASTGAALATSGNAALLSDLAAAAYERGRIEGQTEWILRAIELASRASSLDPGLAPASFNLALAIEAVHAPSQAIAAWNHYLDLDPDSQWSMEARDHVRALTHHVSVIRNRDDTPEDLADRIETELLGRWGDAFEGGDETAAEAALHEAETLAVQLQTCCRNDLYVAAVRRIRHVTRKDREAASGLARAHQQYRDGRAHLAAGRPGGSLALLRASRDFFRKEHSAFAARPWRYLAAAHMYLDSPEAAEGEIVPAIRFCEQMECPAGVLAHLQWVEAFIAGRAGDYQKSSNLYVTALRGFEAAREKRYAGSIHALIAENLAFLGMGEEVWPHLLEGMKSAHESAAPAGIRIAWSTAAEAARRGGFTASELLFEDVLVNAARREQSPFVLSDALMWRAGVAGRPRDAALRDLDEASRTVLLVDDARLQARLTANVAIARSKLEPPARAVAWLTSAIRYFEENGEHYRLAELYAARADARDVLGHAELAEADYAASIRELESVRGVITAAPIRERYFSGGSSVFDRLVRHLWMSGRKDEAFAVAEQSRGRELNGRTGPPRVGVREVAALLAPDEVLLEFVLLEDRVLAWIIRSSGAATMERRLPESSLVRAVEAMNEAMDRGDDFDASLKPVAAFVEALQIPLEGVRRMIIVPNKSLRAVPFAALRNPATGRYLIEERELLYAPSAAAWVSAVRHDRRLRREAGARVLLASYLAGDPERKLARLEQGDAEMRELRGLFGTNAMSIDGFRATPEAVLRAAGGAAIVHIAAHAVQNEQRPEYSSIVLAPSPDGGDLTAATIAAARLPVTRLVFLSSCGAPGRTTHNDAPLTLPEAFLAAGVPVVVGSLRPVDDAATVEFAVTLHRELAAGGDAVAALRRAQLHCLVSERCRDPRFWSSWVALGGAA